MSCEFWPGFWTLPVLKFGSWLLSYRVGILDLWSARVGMLVFYPVCFFFRTRSFKFGFGIVIGTVYSLSYSFRELVEVSRSTRLPMNF